MFRLHVEDSPIEDLISGVLLVPVLETMWHCNHYKIQDQATAHNAVQRFSKKNPLRFQGISTSCIAMSSLWAGWRQIIQSNIE